jgi:hypothetical protein
MTDLELIKSQLGDIANRLDELHQAFPDGVQAHRAAHEAMIKAAVAQETFWNELKLEIAKKGIIGIIIILVGLVLAGISVKLGVWIKQ